MDRRCFLGAVALLGGFPMAARSQASSPKSALPRLWEDFAKSFVTSDGRVVDTGNQGITHSEGLGVALLAAQACNDRPRFDRIYAFARTLKRPDGLYSWKWVQGTGVADANNATDGDLYIAWALLRAALRWSDPRLVEASTTLCKAIRERLVVTSPQGRVLLPGVVGFTERTSTGAERAVVNPSYWVLPALREIGLADPSPVWAELHKDALALMETARFGPRGLPADWLLLDDPVTPWHERSARFGYEAIRIPLFLAWTQKSTHGALRACAKHMQLPGFPAWVALDGPEHANYAAPAGFEAVARLVRKSVYGQPFVLPEVSSDYYSSSLVLLTALAASDLGWA